MAATLAHATPEARGREPVSFKASSQRPLFPHWAARSLLCLPSLLRALTDHTELPGTIMESEGNRRSVMAAFLRGWT